MLKPSYNEVIYINTTIQTYHMGANILYLRSKITKPTSKVRDPKIISADVSIF